MEDYINKFDTFDKKLVYNFQLGDGGLGDNIKFFMYALNFCIKYNIKLYYIKKNILIEKYIKLKYEKMYINENDVFFPCLTPGEPSFIQLGANQEKDIPFLNPNIFYILHSWIFHKSFSYENLLPIQDVFYFTDEVKQNSIKLLSLIPTQMNNYLSIHVRLGDKYLETEQEFILCHNDIRWNNEEAVFDFIKKHYDKKILFFCDNNAYKLKIKNKYSNIFITNSNIGHTSLSNTTDTQVLDAISEMHIMSNSDKIISSSNSGFSIIAAKFKNIPLIKLYEQHVTYETSETHIKN